MKSRYTIQIDSSNVAKFLKNGYKVIREYSASGTDYWYLRKLYWFEK